MGTFTSADGNDSPILAAGEMIFNFMVLNVLWVLCSLPVVTIGASTSAMNYTLIKLRNDEGDSVVRMFFRSLGQNVRQGTILSTGMAAILIVLAAFFIQAIGNANAGHAVYVVISVIVLLLIFVWLLLFIYIFMVLARFDNPVGRTVTNAVYLICLEPFRAAKVFFIAVMMLLFIPLFLFMYFPFGFPMVIFFGIPVTGWLLSKEFNELFARFIETPQ